MVEVAESPSVSLPKSQLRFIGPLGVLAALCLAYAPVLTELARDWIRDANYHHGFLIPLISAYLVWNYRQDLRQASRSPSIIGLAGILVAAALLILGSAGAEVFTQRVSFLVLLASLVLFLYGRQHFRMLLFPIALLFLAIPLPYVIYYGLTAPMQTLAAKIAVFGLQIVGVPALGQGNMIHLPATSLEVAEACSGIRSLYAFLAVGALVAYATSVPLIGRLVIFLLAIPLSVAGNAARVWGTGLGAHFVGPEAAHGTVHELFGVFVFVISLVVFLLLRQAVRKLWSSDQLSPSSSSLSRASMPESFAPDVLTRRRPPT